MFLIPRCMRKCPVFGCSSKTFLSNRQNSQSAASVTEAKASYAAHSVHSSLFSFCAQHVRHNAQLDRIDENTEMHSLPPRRITNAAASADVISSRVCTCAANFARPHRPRSLSPHQALCRVYCIMLRSYLDSGCRKTRLSVDFTENTPKSSMSQFV